jgi:hypothetical protein
MILKGSVRYAGKGRRRFIRLCLLEGIGMLLRKFLLIVHESAYDLEWKDIFLLCVFYVWLFC